MKAQYNLRWLGSSIYVSRVVLYVFVKWSIPKGFTLNHLVKNAIIKWKAMKFGRKNYYRINE
jgi:hypothetical protein